MSPTQTFFAGLLILIVFFWYFATDSDKNRRWLASGLSLLVILFSLVCFWPSRVEVVQPAADGSEAAQLSAPSGKEQPLPGKAFKWKSQINLGLDLQGGTSFLISLRGTEEDGKPREISKKTLDQAVEVIRKRVDKYGIGEPLITPEGSERILVQIPGLETKEIEDVQAQLKKVAHLEFSLVHPQSDQIIQAVQAGAAVIPPGYKIVEESIERNGQESKSQLLVKREADIDGRDVTQGRPFYGDQGFGVSLTFNSRRAKQFGDLTSAHVHERFAILLDGKVQSAPVIQTPILGGNAQITGRFTQEEADNLASVLENPLAVPVTVEETRSASATLGEDSIKSGVYAGIGGLLFVLLLVALYYRLSGLIAILALVVNVVILLGVMGMFHFVLTLPGIAGVILTIGLAVDANVLIFERLREELASGKSLPAAITGAYSKAFSVIFDANTTTIITAGILFWYAAGPVKGFAITLIIGVIASVFTAMIVGRNCFDWAVHLGLQKVKLLHLISDKMNLDFLGRRRLWAVISIVIITVCAANFIHRGQKNFGIDFLGGDLLEIAARADASEEQVRNVVAPVMEKLGVTEIPSIQKMHNPINNTTSISIRCPNGAAGPIKEALAARLPAAFEKTADGKQINVTKEEQVGTLVGNELARNSAIALGLGILGILIFVTLRFELSFAVGAVVALLHDIIITLGIFSLFHRELSLVMVGAILTIAGYSINDTIVVFDRIREGLNSGRKGTIQEIMNASINETLSRTLITSLLTALSVAALFVFGGATLKDFAMAILIGIVVGTYSSICIASPIVLWWSRGTKSNLIKEVKSGDAPAVKA